MPNHEILTRQGAGPVACHLARHLASGGGRSRGWRGRRRRGGHTRNRGGCGPRDAGCSRWACRGGSRDGRCSGGSDCGGPAALGGRRGRLAGRRHWRGRSGRSGLAGRHAIVPEQAAVLLLIRCRCGCHYCRCRGATLLLLHHLPEGGAACRRSAAIPAGRRGGWRERSSLGCSGSGCRLCRLGGCHCLDGAAALLLLLDLTQRHAATGRGGREASEKRKLRVQE